MADDMDINCIGDLVLSVVQRGIPVAKAEQGLDAVKLAYKKVCLGGWLGMPDMWEHCLDVAFSELGLN